MLSLIGLAIGISCATAACRLISSMLFGRTSSDLPTVVSVSVLLLAVACLAGYLPAPPRIDPSPPFAPSSAGALACALFSVLDRPRRRAILQSMTGSIPRLPEDEDCPFSDNSSQKRAGPLLQAATDKHQKPTPLEIFFACNGTFGQL